MRSVWMVLVIAVMSLTLMGVGVAGAQGASFEVDRLDDIGSADECTGAADDCSLRGAVAAANGNGATQDIVTFLPGLTGVLSIDAMPAGNAIDITYPISIQGPGADLITLDGNDERQIFFIDMVTPGEEVEISGLTLTDGEADGDTVNGDTGAGGAICDVDAVLNMDRIVISSSTATAGGSAVASGPTDNRSSITNSTFTGNSGPFIGTLSLLGDTLISSSTFSANVALAGRDVYAFDADLDLVRSTLLGNTALGGAVLVGGTSSGSSFSNSIILGGTGPALGGNNVDGDWNLIDDPGTVVVTPAVPGSNVFGVDPMLGPLAMNGGSTPTHRPAIGSPVIDRGSLGGPLDQRGFASPVDVPTTANFTGGDGTDIGAVELTLAEAGFSAPPPPPPPIQPARVIPKKCKKGTKLRKVKGKRKCVKLKKKKRRR